MPCPVCKHNQINDINRALLTGASLTSLSRQYGLSPAALPRHQEHLLKKMAVAQERFHANLNQGLYCKLNMVLEMVLSVVRGARAGEDFKLFLQAGREATRIAGLMHKMNVPLDPEMIYCLMASSQWGLQDSLLPNAFQALDNVRQTLAVNLMAPCPEPEPEAADRAPVAPISAAASPGCTSDATPAAGSNSQPAETSPLATQNSALETLFLKWEKSGKLPGNIPLSDVVTKEFQ
jgi:hypothetical protein